jgi:hypothetical protein
MNILESRYGLQVFRIHTDSVPACVINLVAIRDRSNVQLKEHAVRSLDTSVVPKLAIPIEGSRLLPDPASSANVDGVAAVLSPASRVPPQVAHGLALDDSRRADGLLGDLGICPAATLALAKRDRRHERLEQALCRVST